MSKRNKETGRAEQPDRGPTTKDLALVIDNAVRHFTVWLSQHAASIEQQQCELVALRSHINAEATAIRNELRSTEEALGRANKRTSDLALRLEQIETRR